MRVGRRVIGYRSRMRGLAGLFCFGSFRCLIGCDKEEANAGCPRSSRRVGWRSRLEVE